MAYRIDKRKTNEVCKILEENGLHKKELGGNRVQFKHPEGGNINVYGNGTILIQGSALCQEKLSILFKEKCGHLLNEESEKAENMFLKFYVSIDKIKYLRQEIERHCAQKGYQSQEGHDSNAHYRFIITDAENNKITVTQYKTNNMLIQGLRTILWEQFTEFIGNELGLTVNTFVAQVLAEPGKEISVDTVITNVDQEQASERIKQRLGECYDFLYDQDKCLIESSECLLGLEIKLNDYFCCVSGTIKAMEGFIKKIVIQLGVYTESEVRILRSNFFGCLIDHDSKRLNSKFNCCLSEEKQKVLHGFIRKVIFGIRNPSFHDGPPPVRNFEYLTKTKSLHDELIGMMNSTFRELQVELMR
jgi:predicted RNA binding protein YcfA (HicA-like mRNA interferase family)